MIIHEKLFYFPIKSSVSFDSLHDWKPSDKHRKKSMEIAPDCWIIPRYEKVVNPNVCHPNNLDVVNGVSLALFRYGESVYAVQSKCPHAGGPLHLGDIEDIGLGLPAITCPWHKWKFELKSGAVLFPSGRMERLDTYPVKVDPITGALKVGFSSFHPAVFTSEEF